MIKQPQRPLSSSANVPPKKDDTHITTPVDCSVNTAASDSNAAENPNAPRVAVAATQGLFAATAFRESEQPATGVVLVTNSDPAISAISLAAIADHIVRKHTIADMSVPQISEITVLHPSGSRGPLPMKAFASIGVKTKLNTVTLGSCSSLNPFTPEGVHILGSQLKPGGCTIVTVDYKNLTRDAAIVALAELKSVVEAIGALLVVFINHTKKQDVGWLQGHCNVFVEVKKCEPGPCAQAAVVLTNVSLAHWHSQGIGRVMVEAVLEPDNVWVYHSEPFISERAIIRLAWCLCYHGAKFDQIKEIVGIDKSNISRGLGSLPIAPDNTVGLVPPKGSRKRWIIRYPEIAKLWPSTRPDQNTGTAIAGEETTVRAGSSTHGTPLVATDVPAPDTVRFAHPDGGKS